jgi:hypothetical protein
VILPNNILTLFLLYTKSLNGIVMVLLKNFYPTKIPLHTSVVVLLISLPLALHGANSSLLTLKTGRGYVDAESDQLKLYALAALESKNLYQDIDTVELWIIQPHHGEIRKHTMTTQELVDWEHYILQPAIENVLNPTYPPVPSDSACQYCAAKTICPAQANMVETVIAAPIVELLTEQEISVLLTKFDMVEDYIKAVRDHALKRMEKGAVIQGWQLAPKRALRSWTSEEEARKQLLFLGLTPDQITKTELITPAQAEKLLTKEERLGLDALTSRISSGLTLARDKGLSQ